MHYGNRELRKLPRYGHLQEQRLSTLDCFKTLLYNITIIDYFTCFKIAVAFVDQ